MYLLSSWALTLLVLVPALGLAYVAAQRRRVRFALRYSNLLVLRSAINKQTRWHRHIPAVLVLLALAAMVVAIARPTVDLAFLRQEKIVILTIDVSASMSYKDISPSRLDAAKQAALEFLAQQDSTTHVGIVAFSHSAALIQAPTTDRLAVAQAINQLETDTSTAIGSGILTALNAISEEQQNAANLAAPADAAQVSTPSAAVSPALVVLLTDGQNTTGPSPLDVAQQAAQKSVRVFTIGIGAPPGPTPSEDPQRDLDEGTLQQIADITHAQYFRALDENALTAIYRNLGVQEAQKNEPTELAPEFTALAAILALAGGTLSFRWSGALP